MSPRPNDGTTVSSSGWMVSADEKTATAVRLDLTDASLTMWPFNPDLFAPPDPEPAAPIVLPLREVVGLDQLGADVIQPLVEFLMNNGERYRLRTTEPFLGKLLEALEATREVPADDVASAELSDLPEPPPPSPTTSKRALLKEIDALRSYIASMGLVERSALRSDLDALGAAVQRLSEHRTQILESVRAATDELNQLRNEIATVRREGELQRLGVFGYAHPIDDAVPPPSELVELRERIAEWVSAGKAVHITSEWVVNGSEEAGRRLATELASLLLRTYNAEADMVLRGLHPFDAGVATERLEAAARAVAELGTSLEITIDPEFHRMRLREVRLVARQHAAANGGTAAPGGPFRNAGRLSGAAGTTEPAH